MGRLSLYVDFLLDFMNSNFRCELEFKDQNIILIKTSLYTPLNPFFTALQKLPQLKIVVEF